MAEVAVLPDGVVSGSVCSVLADPVDITASVVAVAVFSAVDGSKLDPVLAEAGSEDPAVLVEEPSSVVSVLGIVDPEEVEGTPSDTVVEDVSVKSGPIVDENIPVLDSLKEMVSIPNVDSIVLPNVETNDIFQF